MTRQHPQAAKAPEAFPRLFVDSVMCSHVSASSSKVTLTATCSREDAELLRGVMAAPLAVSLRPFWEGFGGRTPAEVPVFGYGRGVPPGEAFTLTAEQLAEWRRCR